MVLFCIFLSKIIFKWDTPNPNTINLKFDFGKKSTLVGHRFSGIQSKSADLIYTGKESRETKSTLFFGFAFFVIKKIFDFAIKIFTILPVLLKIFLELILFC